MVDSGHLWFVSHPESQLSHLSGCTMKIADFGLKNLKYYVFEKNIVFEDVDMLDRGWTNLRFLRTWAHSTMCANERLFANKVQTGGENYNFWNWPKLRNNRRFFEAKRASSEFAFWTSPKMKPLNDSPLVVCQSENTGNFLVGCLSKKAINSKPSKMKFSRQGSV